MYPQQATPRQRKPPKSRLNLHSDRFIFLLAPPLAVEADVVPVGHEVEVAGDEAYEELGIGAEARGHDAAHLAREE